MLTDKHQEPLDLEPEVFPSNRITLSLQSGFEGNTHSISLTPWLLVLLLVVFCGVVLFGLLNAFSNPAANDGRLLRLEGKQGTESQAGTVCRHGGFHLCEAG